MATFSILLSALLVILLILQNTYGIKWLDMGKRSLTWDKGVRQKHCAILKREFGLVRGQLRLCQDNIEVMPLISKAAKETMQTCQQIFQTRRWNCSNILLTPKYTPDLTTAKFSSISHERLHDGTKKELERGGFPTPTQFQGNGIHNLSDNMEGTREQAFVYALGSASLSYTISKACAAGALDYCTCGAVNKHQTGGGFKWGGCGENVQWATKFAKKFTDSYEKKNLKVKGSQKKKRGSVNPAADLDVVMMGSSYINRLLSKEQLAYVNLHNTQAGRKELERALKTQCTCHGVSGSCSVKTCWKGLPTFLEIGNLLQNKYSEALEISVRSLDAKSEMEPVRKNSKQITGEDLVYVTKSPDYCLRDDRTGSLGTRGRFCNSTSVEYDSCDIMCCGRGHTTVQIHSVDLCHCKFRWCCEVVCKRCAISQEKNICN